MEWQTILPNVTAQTGTLFCPCSTVARGSLWFQHGQISVALSRLDIKPGCCENVAELPLSLLCLQSVEIAEISGYSREGEAKQLKNSQSLVEKEKKKNPTCGTSHVVPQD